MPRTTKARPEPVPQLARPTPVLNGPTDEVLTLHEAATYLKLPEEEVLRLVREQDLPARQVGTDWRFLKRAIQEWLSMPPSQAKQEGIWAFAGAWKGDPHAEELLKKIWHDRGQLAPQD